MSSSPPTADGDPSAPAPSDTDVIPARARFRSLIAANPNYFGTFPIFGFEIVEPIASNTTYEEVTCVSYNPQRDLLEATISVKLPGGYSGGLCTDGSLEHVRFYVDYGSGWQDAGAATAKVHDISVERDCAGRPNHPITYTCGVRLNPPRRLCRNPQLPRIRAILSWNLQPPPNTPGFKPVWGNVLDCRAQIAARRFVITDILDKLPKEILQAVPQYAFDVAAESEPFTPKVPPLPLAEIAKQEQGADVPAHRFALPHLAATTTPQFVQTATLVASAQIAKAAQIDLAAVLKILEDGKGDTTYEELTCLGLDEGQQALVASFRLKRPNGYGGDPCGPGSQEYVAFWADWDNTCRPVYLGTAQVTVHNYDDVGRGICYAAVLPVDLGALRRPCDKAPVSRVRAVLSWGVPPSTTDPDAVPYWGNRLDAHVQVAPGRPYDGNAHFTIVGGVAATKVSLATGLTETGAVLGTSTIPLAPVGWAFAGRIDLQGPLDPALAGQQYRLVAHDTSGGGTQVLTDAFTVVDSGGFPHVVTPDPLTGIALWPSWVSNTTGVLGVFSPGGDDLWDVVLEFGPTLVAAATARVQLDSTLRTSVVPGDSENAGDLELVTGGACKLPAGPMNGRFVARDRFFHSWSISVHGGPTGTVPPTPLTVPAGLGPEDETPLAGSLFTLDLSALQPCGYVVQLTIADRVIVNSAQGRSASTERGICIEG